MSNVSISKSNLAIAAVLVAAVFFGAGYFTAGLFNKPGMPNGGQFMANGANGQRSNVQRMANRNPMGGFINGELVKKDASSFSVKQRDGSMKLVLITSSTKAMKMAESNLGEFAIGQQVMVTGSSNSDGSLTAQTVQIRPDDLPGMGGPGGAGAPSQKQPPQQ